MGWERGGSKEAEPVEGVFGVGTWWGEGNVSRRKHGDVGAVLADSCGIRGG